ncbi:MAG TPA: hypothetical protein VNS32_12155 [Flavisolibacter sp.]|nr:hypothetical protein [Flavisolibacter sp.]
MEVKLFVFKDLEKAEEQLNNWLTENKVTISHITQSQSERNGNFLFLISIFYQHPGQYK